MNTLFDNLKLTDNGADFSHDGNHRNALWRIWDKPKPRVMFIGLNPSTATADKDDPTIRKVQKIANQNGFGGVYMMNLYTFITAYPEELSKVNTGVDYACSLFLLKEISQLCEKVVFAWGNFEIAKRRAAYIIDEFPGSYCLQQNKNGTPKHPLYCLDKTIFIPFDTTKL